MRRGVGSNDKTAERERKREREKEPVSGVFVVGVLSKDKNNFVVHVPSLLPAFVNHPSGYSYSTEFRLTDQNRETFDFSLYSAHAAAE